ncbi:MAG: 23S rRNA (adenine(2503)-C(2))-methyltransferase RlmN, partial [Pseudomonadota bacterium]
MTEPAPTPARPPASAIAPDFATLPRRDAPAKPSLFGLAPEALREALTQAGIPKGQSKMRTKQVWQWLYQRGARDFAEMSNLGKAIRADLDAAYQITRPEIVSRQISADGTRKYLLRLGGGHEIEAVYIPEETRGTLCISSQVGCTLTCSFCHTGTQKLVRNLTPGEIVAQILVCRDDLDEWPKPGERPPETRRLSNIVLMGMGEPLYNTDNVRDAMRIAMDGEGLSISRRRITLSTSGVVPEMHRAGEEIGTLLAISLHATTDEVRDTLVPINKKWPIQDL